MTSLEFRADTEQRIKASALLSSNPILRLMLDIAKRETPTRLNSRETVKSEVQAHVLLGATYGYEMAWDKLDELTKPLPEPHQEPVADYGARDILKGDQ